MPEAPLLFLDGGEVGGGATLDVAVLALALFGPDFDLAFATGVILLEKRIGKHVVRKQNEHLPFL